MNSIYSQFNTPQLILIGRENFSVWKLAMEALLQVKDLWGCVTGDPAYSEDSDKDTLARTLIILSIESVNYCHIQGTKTAKEAWDKLSSVFGGSGLAGKVGLLRGTIPTWNQLVSFSSLEEYVNVITDSSMALREMGLKVTDEWIGIQLLAGLTNEYWPLIVELDSSKAIITGVTVKQLLLDNHIKYNPSLTSYAISPVYVKTEEYNGGGPMSTSPSILENIHPRQTDRDRRSLPIAKNVKDWYNNFCESAYVAENYQQDASTSENSRASGFSSCPSIKKDELEVEVRGEHGGYHEACVTDVFENEVEVSFNNECQSKARFAFIDVRLPPENKLKPKLRKGQEIEVYTRVSETSSWGWWKARIDISMGNGFVIVTIPIWLGSKFGHGECVAIDRLRMPNQNAPINHRTFHKREISVPEEQRESAKQDNIHKDFQRAIGAAICRYVPEKGVLLLISRNENLESLSSWLDAFHFPKAQKVHCFLGQLKVNNGTEPLFSNYL